MIGVLWLLTWFGLFRRPEESQFPNAAEREMILSGRGPGAARTEKPWPMGTLLSRVDVFGLLATRFLLDPVFYFYMFWIPQYLARERGMSLADIGALTWIPFFALGVSNIAAGHFSDVMVARGWAPRKARMTLMLCAALLTPASWLASTAGTPAMAIGLMSVLMLAHGVWIANFITLIGDTVAPAEVGTAVGLTGTCGGVAGMISNLIVGPVVDKYSFAPAFLVSALLYPAAWAILAFGRGRAGGGEA
jgi:ACS family hexuronate transporter-like MFS transporter